MPPEVVILDSISRQRYNDIMNPQPATRPVVNPSQIRKIIANRTRDGAEQYLVLWVSSTTRRVRADDPLSWHYLAELKGALHLIQEYLDSRPFYQNIPLYSRKRKSPSTGLEERNDSRSPRTPQHIDEDVFNGILSRSASEITIRQAPDKDASITRVNAKEMPTESMRQISYYTPTTEAENAIRNEVKTKLKTVQGPPVTFSNVHDRSSLPLTFEFVNESVLREGVEAAPLGTLIGCQKCRPDMGANRGCEYTRLCECLEFAAVDESRLTEEQRAELKERRDNGSNDTSGMPKKFPYLHPSGFLSPFYRKSRHPIYECNQNCQCGPHCKNRVVQHGRKVALEIFKTPDRGWGLRCPDGLREGQFVDTYRGEIITDAEATRREDSSTITKDSYLYVLDKWQEAEEIQQESIFIVDGQFMGGPTRFMNHSCDPNCRQYTVSYNKYDVRMYDLAFFAARDIAPNEELTFDYLDKDDEDDQPEPTQDIEESQEAQSGQEIPKKAPKKIRCLCGSQFCRNWLWL